MEGVTGSEADNGPPAITYDCLHLDRALAVEMVAQQGVSAD